MKYTKARHDFIFIINPLVILLCGLFYFIFPSIMQDCFYAFWISTIAAIFLIVTQLGNHRLAHHADAITARLPWQHWLLCILVLEITLLGVYLGMCYVCGVAFLVNTTPHPHLFSETLRAELLHNGLFPWSLYAVIAAGIAVVAYRKDTNAFFSHLLKPLMCDEPGERFGLIVNTAARRATIFALAILLTFMTFLLMSLALSPDIQLITGFQLPALLTTLILLFFSYTKIIKRYTGKIFSRHIPTGIAFTIFCLVLCFIVLLINILVAGLAAQQNTGQVVPPTLITRWIQMNWHTTWSIFSFVFWVALTPLVCNCMVRVSKGYRIRDMVIGILILPIIITTVLCFQMKLHLNLLSLSTLPTQILSLISFFILLPLLLNHGNSGNAIFSYFPKQGMIKHRDEKLFFEKLVQLTIVSIYFYLVIGVNGLGLFIVAPLFLFVPCLIVMMVTVLKNIA